ncbi:MAG: hypothetical protein EHM49_01270 [Deltaproteobacteria bacterium]|nr:MAG: hypothetical protein EHM49_01270 [Deltaproteobacteria bacterium]
MIFEYEKECPSCGSVQPKLRVTCIKCHAPFYRSPVEKRSRRTRDDVNEAILAERREKTAQKDKLDADEPESQTNE